VDGEVSPTLHEHEAQKVGGGAADARWLPRRPLADAARARPAIAALAALAGLATLSAVLRALLVGQVHGPFVFMDELGYERMAQSFAHTGHFSLFGKTGLAYSPLYPIVLSPIYALTDSMQTAYEWAKVENAVLLSLSVFPIYAIARSVLPRGRSLGVAALSVIAPLMLYSGFEMSENLAYPLCLLAFWAMLRAVRQPGMVNDAVLLAAILLATGARLQLVVLVPAALTAVVLVALLRPAGAGRRAAALRAVSEHRLLFGAAGVGLAAGLARAAMNGGNLPLAGRYANVGTAHANALRVLELAVQHLAELDFAVGVVPFAAALFAGYALFRFGFPRRALVFASVAIASTFWLLLEVAFDAAAFDAASSHPKGVHGAFDVPRIHERYLIYLVPFFLVALVAVLPLIRRRIVRTRWQVLLATAVALFPVVIPFGTVINGTSTIDSFGLQPFAWIVSGKLVPIPHAMVWALVLSGLLAFGYLAAVADRLPLLAVFTTALALLGLSALELARLSTPIAASRVGIPARADWVDRAVGVHGNVTLVGLTRGRRIPVEETAFWNSSITRVYYTCGTAFGADFGELRLKLRRTDGALTSPSGAVHAQYVVAPADLGIRGRVLAQDEPGKLVLLAPTRGRLTVPSGRRSAVDCAR
jgi:hypothetical protein